MSLKNLSLTTDPLVRNIFALFYLRFYESVVSVLGLTFLHHQDSSPKVVNYLHYFGA